MNQESFLGLSPTAWVAILTVFIAMATITQAAIYGLMNSTTKRVERAYVSMSQYRDGLRFGFEGSGSGDTIWTQDVTATLKISNHRNTPARVTRVLIQPLIAIELLRERPEYDESYG